MIKYILFILVPFFGYSQNKVCVLNAQTSEPVSYANIWKENKIYITADSLGYFNYNPKNDQNYKITAKVLALHGHLDPMVTPDDVRSFTKELDDAEANWQMNIYGKALHAFTNPEANT